MRQCSGMTPERSVAYSASVDHAARYQLLDHATDKASLWEVRLGITTIGTDGRRIDRHKELRAEELQPELERLLQDGHVELFEETDPGRRVLGLDEALEVAADNRYWYSPLDLQEVETRPTIYALSLTDSGTEEFRRERARANPG